MVRSIVQQQHCTISPVGISAIQQLHQLVEEDAECGGIVKATVGGEVDLTLVAHAKDQACLLHPPTVAHSVAASARMLPGVLAVVRLVQNALINVDDGLTCEEGFYVLNSGSLSLMLVHKTIHLGLHSLDAAVYHFQLLLEEAIDLRLGRESV